MASWASVCGGFRVAWICPDDEWRVRGEDRRAGKRGSHRAHGGHRTRARKVDGVHLMGDRPPLEGSEFPSATYCPPAGSDSLFHAPGDIPRVETFAGAACLTKFVAIHPPREIARGSV